MQPYIIQGVTGSGKTKFAYALAKEINGELINADSRQVYTHASIGVNKEIFPDIQTHVISFIAPTKRYNVFLFVHDALQAIEAIKSKGKTPIIVGGTAFYIDILTGKIPLSISSSDYHIHLEKTIMALQSSSIQDIQDSLYHIDQKLFLELNNSEKHNKQRLIQKIAKISFSDSQKGIIPALTSYYKIGISIENPEIFKETIKKRVDTMFEQGLIEEVLFLYSKYGPNIQLFSSIGYKEFLTSEKNLEEFSLENIAIIRNKIYTHTLQYTKRQMTWLKKDKEIHWYKNRDDFSNKVISEVIKKNS